MVPGMAASLRPRALLARRNGQGAAGPDVHIWEPVHAERLIDLADVIRVMRQETHEDTLTRMNLNPPVQLSAELVLEHRRRPSLETIPDDRTGRLQRGDQLIRITPVAGVVFTHIAV